MPKSPFFKSQEDFDAAQRALGVEPVPSPNKKNSSSHPKSPPKVGSPRWNKMWLKLDEEVRRSKPDAEAQDRDKASPKLYQRFPNKSPKAT